MYIRPAYGRLYGDEEAVRAAWNEGKDFKIINGPYLSIRDVDKLLPLDKPIILVAWSLGGDAQQIRLAD